MTRVYAFTDESGNHGFDFSKQDISSHFIITAVVVTESNLQVIQSEIEEIRKRFFQTGEIKSSSVGKNHNRRVKILSELIKCNFKIFSIIFDKQKIYKDSGLMYKKTFYKFLNNIVHNELRRAFQQLTICADEIGGNDYMKSFIQYVKEQEDIPTLLNDREFYFENSGNNVLVQLADFISGTLSFSFEESKKSTEIPNFLKMLEKKLIRIEFWPQDLQTYIKDKSFVSEEYDIRIAELCLMQANKFIELYGHSDDEETSYQVLVLKYLCFRFLNNSTRTYISTKELINNLKYRTGNEVSTHYFRSRIIAKLRDDNVIISSSPKGYKIPSKEEELYDFINHGTSVIIPMLGRLKKCRDLVHMATVGELDLFNNTEYVSLKKYFDK